MPTFKTVWQFTESNGSTFNEVWYKDASSLTGLINPADSSIQLRLSFLNQLNSLVRIRVSQVGVLRNTQNVLIGAAGKNAGPLGPLPVGAAFVLNISGVNGGSRKLWMRGGNRDDYIRNPATGVDQPSQGFLQQLGPWLTAMNAAGFGILRLTPLTNPATQITPITIVDGSITTGRATLTMQTPIVLVAGSTVILQRFNPKELPRLNGKFTVISATVNTFTIPYATPANAKITTNTGQAKLQAYDPTHLVNPTASGFDHLGTRTSKSPLSGSRGAKRAARIRQLS